METWIETRSGIKVDVQDPKPEQFDIKDIAYALSNTCRFNGHSAGFYSVAEHSVAVALRLPTHLRLAGLLHDATEAYLGDIPSPIKQFLPDYKAIEARFETALAEKFATVEHSVIPRCTAEEYKLVKQADIDALYTEAHFLIESQGKDWSYFQGPVAYKVNYDLQPICLPPKEAFKLFLGMYYDIVGVSHDTKKEAPRIVLAA